MGRSGERSVVLLGFLAALCLLGSGNAQRLPKGFANPIDSCPKLPPHNATVIQDLRPSDIKVVMALGDSITAGFGIMGRDVPDILDEYRGLRHLAAHAPAPIGGDDGAITMANFFRHYSPNVVGASLGRHVVELPEFPYYDQDQLNGAQSNAGVASLMYQLEHLIQRLNSDPRVDMDKDWKIINLLIGANDACPLCLDITPPSIASMGDFYEQNLRKVVETAYQKIPRLFFNILPMFNVSQVYYLSLGLPYCFELHDVLPVECLCAFDSTAWRRNYLDQVLQEFNRRIYKLYDEWKAKKLTTFALQVQPFSANRV
ncbi:phospholipase, putative [Acanthamoeba castellanii str. Neff]|uniref:Phospholipase, putative n=1 Tax=Acanthamoeba castellanii (strain ATCC 30010 / Neff) TaxID=1257118 RepID=L8HJC3_ACACF|nr:phospholipase, putative [Acanthamoeba castellanii str. Neff]ELR25684.1 phospholipase, putative [Acanthamoeba castellanii str. Neff]